MQNWGKIKENVQHKNFFNLSKQLLKYDFIHNRERVIVI